MPEYFCREYLNIKAVRKSNLMTLQEDVDSLLGEGHLLILLYLHILLRRQR